MFRCLEDSRALVASWRSKLIFCHNSKREDQQGMRVDVNKGLETLIVWQIFPSVASCPQLSMVVSPRTAWSSGIR